jgi:SulP family sulfate permease
MPDGALTAHLYLPKLVTVFRQGYGVGDLRRDAVAGLTVAIVALPLSMAIAVGSGVSPDRGLFTAIVGGFVVSALSGSRFQIGGPAGAFIVLVAATASKFGIEGLLLAVLLSGIMLALAGALRLGSLIRHIPHAVTVGFTSGIAVTILASQLKDLGGLRLNGPEPGLIVPKLLDLAAAISTLNPAALGLGLGTTALIFAQRRWKPNWPGMLIALAIASVMAALLHLHVDTIGSRFGGIPHTLPIPRLPDVNWRRILQVLPAALSFTLLGGVESLLSAKVADGMTGRRHRSNMELIGQGVANVASALFGGISVTGTIARTATNIRAGGRSPVAGILHAGFLLVFMLVAVCWSMAEKAEFYRLLLDWRTAAVLLTTFGLTLALDLTTGIVTGCLVAAALTILKRAVPAEGA